MPVVILNDDKPEATEHFYLRIHSPKGGVNVDNSPLKINIKANDNFNGVVSLVQKCLYKFSFLYINVEMFINIPYCMLALLYQNTFNTKNLKVSKNLNIYFFLSLFSEQHFKSLLFYNKLLEQR